MFSAVDRTGRTGLGGDGNVTCRTNSVRCMSRGASNVVGRGSHIVLNSTAPSLFNALCGHFRCHNLTLSIA